MRFNAFCSSQKPITSSYTAFRRFQMKSLMFHSAWKFTKISNPWCTLGKLSPYSVFSTKSVVCKVFWVSGHDVLCFLKIHTYIKIYIYIMYIVCICTLCIQLFFFWCMRVIEAICHHYKTIRRTIKITLSFN